MTTSDEHLELSLSEYNERISILENGSDMKALLEALTYRSTILLLLESYVSCVSDVEDALEIAEKLMADGEKIEPGILIKLYENRGQLCFDSDVEQMLADYDEITKVLDAVGDSAKLYERKEMITMCLDCAADLIDKEEYDRALPFAEKGLKVIADGDSVWELNFKVEAYNILGQAYKTKKDYEKSKECFEMNLMLCHKLGKDLSDMMEFAFAYVNLGDIAEDEKNIPEMIRNHEEAIKIFTVLNTEGKLDDVKILIDLHNGLATILMDSGEIEKAEKHLMAAMKLGMPELQNNIDNLKKKMKKD